ncbi:MAG: PTS sugar transporter subunit IIA [Acidobacteriota bacterium]
MSLVDLIDPHLVVLELEAHDTAEALSILVKRMVEAALLDDEADALRKLVDREQVMSTGIGGGIAIPHARSPEVDRTVIAVGRSRQGVPFNAVDGAPVKAIFLILGPPESSAEHVKVLARIARLVKRPDFLEQMAGAGTETDLLEIIRRMG